MDTFYIFLSILVVILTFLLPFTTVEISLKDPKSISIKGWIYLSIILLIIVLTGFNTVYSYLKSQESDKYQKDTKTNTETILNKTENSLQKLEIVSQRLENLNPRLDLLEEKTLKSINKIDSSLNLFDRYDTLQKLKFLETEPKVIIDSIIYYFDTEFDCYFIRLSYLNIGGRNSSKLKFNIHFFYCDSTLRITSDRNLTTDDVLNENYLVPKKISKSDTYFTLSNGCYKSPKVGFIQVIITYYDELLKKNHSTVQRYQWDDKIIYGMRFKNILKYNSRGIDRYIKSKKLIFDTNI